MKLAASCSHPDAEWLCRVCAGRVVHDRLEALALFFGAGPGDVKALTFASLLTPTFDTDGLRIAADAGYAFAQARMAMQVPAGEVRFHYASLSASQKERDGYFALGTSYLDAGGEESLDFAKENFLAAAKLLHVFAMTKYGDLLGNSSPTKWEYYALAAAHGHPTPFIASFQSQTESSVVFVIGKALVGKVERRGRGFPIEVVIMGVHRFDQRSVLLDAANRAIQHYQNQVEAAKKAVHAWSLVAIRLKIVKDMRVLIAKAVWERRWEANY